MQLCDLHTHTIYSYDGSPTATPDAMCRRALEIGLTSIAFTDHCDVNGQVEGIYDPYHADEAFAAIQAVKEAYRGRLNVICGLELGNAPQYPEAAAAFLAAHPYEFVIGSLHNLRNVPDFWMLKFELMSPVQINQLFDRALDETIEMAQFPGLTTIGHMTYMNRYVASSGVPFSFKPFYEKIEHLYRLLIQRDIALEINVSSLWQGLGFPMPSLELLKLYTDCGGKLITIGSDAHAPENLGKGIRKGYAMLSTLGITHVMAVENGQRIMVPIQ